MCVKLSWRKWILLTCIGLGAFLFTTLFVVGGELSAPVRQAVGNLPADLAGRSIEFHSDSGATLRGWFIPGKPGGGAIALLHGVRANRLSMLERARFLSHAGYAVLLFDFQAHGESSGKHITFGYQESKDAQAAISYLRANAPGEKVGVIGVSLGGVAVLLATPQLNVDAMVLEMVYPTVTEAISDRLTMRLGGWARILTPLLTCQLKPRLGITSDDLRPIDHVGQIAAPKLFIAGAEDRHTRIEESRQLFAAASEPKQLWVVSGAKHQDLHAFATQEYEQKVLSFFSRTLRTQTADSLSTSAPPR
jgi:alpha-beta hydrolase superfamily lysophospholipase